MLKYGDKGPAVAALQNNLLKLGKKLPRFGADGALGDETLNAVALFLADHDRTDPDLREVSDAELSFINDLANKPVNVWTPGCMIDRTRASDRDVDRGPRSWPTVTGICLHQTACVLGEKPERWDGVGAHVGITYKGVALKLHEFNRVVWHGNAFNADTVGFEIDGTYPGRADDPRTLWDPGDGRKPMKPSLEAMEATRDMCRYVKHEVERNGGKLKFLYAHRQASASRQSDPGSAIWAVALDIMKELGLSDGGPGYIRRNKKNGDGLPIPEAWDANRKGIKY